MLVIRQTCLKTRSISIFSKARFCTHENLKKNPAVIEATGEKNPLRSDDRDRVNAAMRAKTEGIKNHAEGSNTTVNSEEIFGYSSIDFGNTYNLPHPIWNKAYHTKIQLTHREPSNNVDRMAYWTVKILKFNLDWMSGWSIGTKSYEKSLNRCIFLEAVAGVPGSVGGILRHLNSLRRLRRDNGWIHTLLEEAENERMHLLTYLELKKPGPFFRFMIWGSQGVFFNFYFFAYLISPIFCHRIVGYLEEQAVSTYTSILNGIDDTNPNNPMKKWNTIKAPEIAKTYWKLPDTANMRDVIEVIRADETHHRDVNHAFGNLDPNTGVNPFKPGY